LDRNREACLELVEGGLRDPLDPLFGLRERCGERRNKKAVNWLKTNDLAK
jgi:hypothetical protein